MNREVENYEISSIHSAILMYFDYDFKISIQKLFQEFSIFVSFDGKIEKNDHLEPFRTGEFILKFTQVFLFEGTYL